MLIYENLIESFRNDRLCVALSRCLKRARWMDRGGIANEAAWEAKKSTGEEECRKRLLTPSSHIDTFLQAFCPSASRYVRDVPRMPISRLAGCSSLYARDLHSLFRISFATGMRRSGREIAHRWNFNEKCPLRRAASALWS